MISGVQRRALGFVAFLTLVLAASFATGDAQAGSKGRGGADPGVALHWYDVTNDTVTAAAFKEPVTQSRTWAVSWLAAARAVQDSPGNGRGAAIFRTAAFAGALHDTLVSLVPARHTQLDSELDATLSTLPDGRPKQAGLAAGQDEASRVLADRNGDGLDVNSVDQPFTPPPAGPGVWQPTPPTFGPAIRAGQGKAKPFLLERNDQFRPGPPPALDSQKYRRALAEVRAYGEDTSSVRTPQQTDVALFWEPATNVQYVQVVRQALAQNQARSLSWGARFVAAFNVITVDAQIAIYEAKYHYLFWRPVTAIRTGSIDPDPDWNTFFASPLHPEYPSGHAGYAGAAEGVLTAFDGWRPRNPVTATSPTDPDVTHSWSSWAQITREVIDARVWEGVHYRFSDVTAARVGEDVAAWEVRHLGRLGI